MQISVDIDPRTGGISVFANIKDLPDVIKDINDLMRRLESDEKRREEKSHADLLAKQVAKQNDML